MTKSVELRREAPPVPAQESVLGLIERVARDPSVPLDRMRELLDMRREIETREAETEFNRALSEVQAEIGRVKADALNPQTRSKYATYGTLDRHLRPIYTRHGFALSFDTGAAPAPEYIRVVCRVSHRAGYSREHHIDMPADGKGAKGGDVMTKTHATGAAASYGMRYLLKMIFNVAIGEDDKDGNAPAGPKITADQAADLEALVTEVGRTTQQLCKKLGITALADLPADKYEKTVEFLQGLRQ